MNAARRSLSGMGTRSSIALSTTTTVTSAPDTGAPLPSVINAATLRATFTDETLHQQVYIWNNQGALGTDAAGGIPTNNSTFYWVR